MNTYLSKVRVTKCSNIFYILNCGILLVDLRNLILPPALDIMNLTHPKIVGRFSQTNLTIGCAPTHPSIQVVLNKMGANGAYTIVSDFHIMNQILPVW